MISIVTTFRASDKHRLNNLFAVERHLYTCFPSWEIVVVEQDTKSSIEYRKFSGKPIWVLAHNPGLFNKSWGMNLGYRLCKGEILVMADADMLIAAEDLQRAVDAVTHSLDIVRPYRHLIALTKQETQLFRDTGALPATPTTNQGYDRTYRSENICLAGGMFVVRRAFYESTGGFDERFRGWGGEDDAFSIRAQALTSRSVVARKATAWHLWHPGSNRNKHSDYRNNLTVLSKYYGLAYDSLYMLHERGKFEIQL